MERSSQSNGISHPFVTTFNTSGLAPSERHAAAWSRSRPAILAGAAPAAAEEATPTSRSTPPSVSPSLETISGGDVVM